MFSSSHSPIALARLLFDDVFQLPQGSLLVVILLGLCIVVRVLDVRICLYVLVLVLFVVEVVVLR